MTGIPPRHLRLEVDIAVQSCGCSVPECVRVTAPGDVLGMRQLPDSRAYEPLCPVHFAEAVEDVRLRVRLWFHEEKQRDEGNRIVDHAAED